MKNLIALITTLATFSLMACSSERPSAPAAAPAGKALHREPPWCLPSAQTMAGNYIRSFLHRDMKYEVLLTITASFYSCYFTWDYETRRTSGKLETVYKSRGDMVVTESAQEDGGYRYDFDTRIFHAAALNENGEWEVDDTLQERFDSRAISRGDTLRWFQHAYTRQD